MSNETTHTGRCFCGDVEFTLTGEPEAMAYCHCDSCRQWSAGPLSAFTLWKPENVKITKGEDKLGGYTGNPLSDVNEVVSNRVWCKSCGGHVYTDHPTMGVIDVPAVVIKDFTFKPGFHVHYQESVHPMKDGLPKFRDLPAEAGGSGEQLAE
ncbi:GFA family protein [Kaarinaea lacus]